MKRFSPYTDLALEAAEAIGIKEREQKGIEVAEKESEAGRITTVRITNSEGSSRTGKPQGSYITLESPYMRENAPDQHSQIKEMLAESLAGLCDLGREEPVLVVGLGNRYVTPDSLGPKVISGILVTRHIKDSLPDELKGKVRPVAAVTPGVMGLTGIESGEIIKGIAERIKPSAIIAIDALAARSASRINTTIQLADTGVTPGAGVGNKRFSLNRETMGIPVIAIGVPTVVDAATLVNDSLNSIIGSMKEASSHGSEFYRMLEELSDEERYELIAQCLDPYTENMFVTPKEVDSVVESLADIISGGINMALHEGISSNNVDSLL